MIGHLTSLRRTVWVISLIGHEARAFGDNGITDYDHSCAKAALDELSEAIMSVCEDNRGMVTSSRRYQTIVWRCDLNGPVTRYIKQGLTNVHHGRGIVEGYR